MTEIPSRLTAALSDRYRIERELGAGGMATVYLAEDLKHQRQVAIKVLKPELAAVLGAERFIQEITTTAQLQHPHILPLFDSGTADGFLFYVMPYIEGETLRDKLSRETQLGVEEAVRITREVADALDYAHRHGVIHRDIKPENILLHDGRPMVADFGIALAVSAAAGGRMTETGMSLGTPHYMSPEQATADKEITGRSDVYSLASVLYEMLTGDPPHTGSSAQQIIVKIIADEARPVSEVRKAVPANVAAAVGKALEKLPADRFETAKAFTDALADPGFSVAVGAGATAVGPASTGGRWRARLIAAAGVALAAIGAAVWGWVRPPAPQPVIRYALALPAAARHISSLYAPVPSPDGSFLVFVGPSEHAGTQLWIKRRDREAPTPIPGTDGAGAFTISPEGAWIAFTTEGPAGGVLQKIPVTGGAAVTLATGDVSQGQGIAWLDDGTLVFPNREVRGLLEVAASGGDVSKGYQSDSLTYAPSPLPGGRGVLFGQCDPGLVSCDLRVLDMRSKTARRLLPTAATGAQYFPPGYIAYPTPAGGLFAVRFDVGRMQVRGSPIPIADSLTRVFPGDVSFNVSPSGMLVLSRGGAVASSFQLVWVDRQGRDTPVDSSWTFDWTEFGQAGSLALSPDGSEVALGLHTGAGDNIWVKRLPTGPPRRVTFDPAPDYRARWTADGRYVTYVGPEGFYRARPDGVGKDSLLLAGTFQEGVVSPDGSWYLLRQGSTGYETGNRDIVGYRPGVDSGTVPLIATQANEAAIALSPDGKWLAYESDETGITQVFVQPFPNVDVGKWPVSRQGGFAPLWSRDGRELFYLRGDTTMMAVSVTEGTKLRLGDPRPLFKVAPDRVTLGLGNYTFWDVAADGRFLMGRALSSSSAEPGSIIVVRNWLENWRRSLKGKEGS